MSTTTFELLVDADTVAAVARNARPGNRFPTAAATSTLKHQTEQTAKALRAPMLDGLVSIAVTQHSRTAHHRDPDNVSGPAKAIIDGLVQAGVLEGDCSCHVGAVVLRQVNGDSTVPEGCHRFVVALAPTTDGREVVA